MRQTRQQTLETPEAALVGERQRRVEARARGVRPLGEQRAVRTLVVRKLQRQAPRVRPLTHRELPDHLEQRTHPLGAKKRRRRIQPSNARERQQRRRRCGLPFGAPRSLIRYFAIPVLGQPRDKGRARQTFAQLASPSELLPPPTPHQSRRDAHRLRGRRDRRRRARKAVTAVTALPPGRDRLVLFDERAGAHGAELGRLAARREDTVEAVDGDGAVGADSRQRVQRRVHRRAQQLLWRGHRVRHYGGGGVDDPKHAVGAADQKGGGAVALGGGGGREGSELRDRAKRLGQHDHPRKRRSAKRPHRQPSAHAAPDARRRIGRHTARAQPQSRPVGWGQLELGGCFEGVEAPERDRRLHARQQPVARRQEQRVLQQARRSCGHRPSTRKVVAGSPEDGGVAGAREEQRLRGVARERARSVHVPAQRPDRRLRRDVHALDVTIRQRHEELGPPHGRKGDGNDAHALAPDGNVAVIFQVEAHDLPVRIKRDQHVACRREGRRDDGACRLRVAERLQLILQSDDVVAVRGDWRTALRRCLEDPADVVSDHAGP